jgi:hypothetical protein
MFVMIDQQQGVTGQIFNPFDHQRPADPLPRTQTQTITCADFRHKLEGLLRDSFERQLNE